MIIFQWLFYFYLVLTTPWIRALPDEYEHHQWFHTLSLVIPTILSYVFFPEVALTFTILTAIHIILLYAFCILGKGYPRRPITSTVANVFLVISALMFVYACSVCWQIAISTLLFATISYLIADAIKVAFDKSSLTLVLNSVAYWVYFFLLLGAILMLSTAWWIKLVVILVLLGSHYIIDYLSAYEFATIYHVVNAVLPKKD